VRTDRLLNAKHKSKRTEISFQDLAQDRAFWHNLLERRADLDGLPEHSGGGYRNRRFAIVRNAAWITLYRARLPFPQMGVFLRCAGLAGEAFFALADSVRPKIEPRLLAEVGPSGTVKWGISHRPGMTDVAAVIAAPPPWNDRAAEWQIVWMLRVGAVWWNCFAHLTNESVVETSAARTMRLVR